MTNRNVGRGGQMTPEEEHKNDSNPQKRSATGNVVRPDDRREREREREREESVLIQRIVAASTPMLVRWSSLCSRRTATACHDVDSPVAIIAPHVSPFAIIAPHTSRLWPSLHHTRLTLCTETHVCVGGDLPAAISQGRQEHSRWQAAHRPAPQAASSTLPEASPKAIPLTLTLTRLHTQPSP